MTGWNTARRSPVDRGSFTDRPWLLQGVDIGLASTLILAPFFMGGRTPLGQLVLCLLSTWTTLLWCLYQGGKGDGRWKFTGAEPVMLLGIGLIVLQCCEIPNDWLASLSPRVPDLLAGWSEEDGAPIPSSWNRISFTPYDTLSNLVVIVACLQLFFVAAQRLRRLDDIRELLGVLAVGGGVMAVFGIAQFLFSNGKFFWIYEHPMTDTRHVAKGSFTNANHFANYLALLVPAQLLMLVECLGSREFKQARRRHAPPLHYSQNTASMWKAGFWGGLLGLSGLAILLTMSRGGMIFCVAGVLATLTVLWSKSLLSTRDASVVVLLAVISLGGTLAFGDLVSKSLEQNFTEITSQDVDQLDPGQVRRKIWAANLSGISEFPMVGTGLGSHREVYWRWFNHPHHGTEFTHAESGYLQVPLETGVIGASLAGLLWLIVLLWCAQGLWNASTLHSSGVMAVVVGGVVICLTHAICDFVWYVPACMNIVLLYAACAWRISLMRFTESATREQLAAPEGSWIGRFAWIGSIPLVLALGGWMVHQKLPEVAAAPLWDEFQRLSRTGSKPLQGDEFDLSETIQRRRDDLALATAEADPHNHRAQLQAGLACLHQFAREQEKADNNMPLRQIREAARASFGDLAEMNRWLNQPGVLGENRKYLEEAMDHFRASLAACPLQPRPYVELSDLVWLEGGDPALEQALVQQAVRSRPFDARANFTQGTLCWLDGEQQAALAHWRIAFQLDSEYRGHIIETLAAYVPAGFFLDNFELDQEGLKQLRTAYKEGDDRNGYLRIVDALARACVREAVQVKGLQAEHHWSLAHACFDERGDRKNAYHAATEAVKSNPSSFRAHKTLGVWLYKNQAFEEAVPHLTWCHRRKPDDESLRQITQQAIVKSQRKSPTSSIAEGEKESLLR